MLDDQFQNCIGHKQQVIIGIGGGKKIHNVHPYFKQLELSETQWYVQFIIN